MMKLGSAIAAPARDDTNEALSQLALRLQEALAAGQLDAIEDKELVAAFAALAKTLAAKLEASDGELEPVERDVLTATETVVLVTELLRAADLNVFDLAMWFRRAR